jgi:hypothetical protein
MALVGVRCGLVNLTDVGAFGVKGRIGFWRQPVTKAMRFKVGLFFKKRPTERCEMFETKPRRIASSAISRWLQWLIGRSLSDGLRRRCRAPSSGIRSASLRWTLYSAPCPPAPDPPPARTVGGIGMGPAWYNNADVTYTSFLRSGIEELHE